MDESAAGQAPKAVSTGRSGRASWQLRLLPLMVNMLVALTLFFFIASCVQLIYVHQQILKEPAFLHRESLELLSSGGAAERTNPIEAARLRAAVALEWASLERHEHQASVLLLSRVWTSYLGFVTGMTLALVGAAFILGQLRSSGTEISGTAPTGPVTLKTASPGLVMCVLGSALMIATIVVHHPIETEDGAVFLRSIGTAPAGPAVLPPAIVLPRSDAPANDSLQSKPAIHAPH